MHTITLDDHLALALATGESTWIGTQIIAAALAQGQDLEAATLDVHDFGQLVSVDEPPF